MDLIDKPERLLRQKKEYVKRARELLGDETEEFLKVMAKKLPQTIRVNSIKITRSALKKKLEENGWKIKEEKFYKDAFTLLEEKTGLGNTLEHFLGYYYCQEIVSMLPPIALGPKPGSSLLETCAAPGSKTTQCAQIMKNTGAIAANDVKRDRIKALVSNCQRCGCANVLFTMCDGANIHRRFEQKFDFVIVDAPCSGESLIRKSWKYIREWRESLIFSSQRTQKKLIISGFKALKPGGLMTYSTCTLSPEENEEVVKMLLDNEQEAELQKIKIKWLKTRKGLASFKNKHFGKEMENCVRIYPHDNDTGAFFITLIKKKK